MSNVLNSVLSYLKSHFSTVRVFLLLTLVTLVYKVATGLLLAHGATLYSSVLNTLVELPLLVLMAVVVKLIYKL